MGRVFDPVQLCTECDSPAAFRQLKCHDCLSEADADYMPDQTTIRIECAAIREDWSPLRYSHSGEPPVPYETPIVKMVQFH